MDLKTDIGILGLEPRTYNCLKRNRINTYEELSMLSQEDLKTLKGMGESSLRNVKNCLDSYNKCNIYVSKVTPKEKIENLFSKIEEKDREFLLKIIQILYEDLTGIYKDAVEYDQVKEGVIRLSYYILENLNTTDNFLINSDIQSIIYSDNLFFNIVSTIVIRLLKDYNFGYTKEEIIERLPVSFQNSEQIEELFQFLKNDIEIDNDLYFYFCPSIHLFIDNLKVKRNSEIIKKRLSGSTLAETGESFGITRERVRQIVSKFFNKLPVVKEDRHLYWYTNYNLNEDQFCTIFNVDNFTYNYLDSRYKKGEKFIEEIINDVNVKDYIKESLEKYSVKDKILFKGEYIDKTRDSIIYVLMKARHFEESCKLQDILSEYLDFCKENDIEDSITLHAFETYLQRCPYIISTFGHMYRFYDINSYDFEKFVKEINFDEYEDLLITTQKIYNMYPDMMKEYDIKTKGELHNILKKNSKYLPDNVKCRRMPHIEIGIADREKQVRNLLETVVPIPKKDFRILFEDKYGVDQNTFKAEWAKYIEDRSFGDLYK